MLNSLQGQVIRSGVENVMAWQVTRRGTFTVKSFYYSIVGRSLGLPIRYCAESFGLSESHFFCLGSSLGIFFNSRSVKMEGLASSK